VLSLSRPHSVDASRAERPSVAECLLGGDNIGRPCTELVGLVNELGAEAVSLGVASSPSEGGLGATCRFSRVLLPARIRTSFCRHSLERLASACIALRKSSGTCGPSSVELRRFALWERLSLEGRCRLWVLESRSASRFGETSREPAGEALQEEGMELEREEAGE